MLESGSTATFMAWSSAVLTLLMLSKSDTRELTWFVWRDTVDCFWNLQQGAWRNVPTRYCYLREGLKTGPTRYLSQLCGLCRNVTVTTKLINLFTTATSFCQQASESCLYCFNGCVDFYKHITNSLTQLLSKWRPPAKNLTKAVGEVFLGQNWYIFELSCISL